MQGGQKAAAADSCPLSSYQFQETIMGNHACTLLHALTTVMLFGLLASAQALAQDNPYAALLPAGSELQSQSTNDCYKDGRSRRLMLRVADLSSLWHYATRILRPTPDASAAAPRSEIDKRKNEKGLVWRVGTGKGGVLVSASLTW